jgi:hypothetical protein
MPTKEKHSELDRLAHRIAAEAAEGAIESFCPYESNARPRWYNTGQVARLEKSDVARAVKYLELRGMLKRHPSNADLVRCRRG